MTQEDKNLLLKDLCARLPYGVKCRWESDGFSNEGELTDICHQEGVNGFKYWDGYLNNDGEDIPIEIIKPYLRPMSSMTEEEKVAFTEECDKDRKIALDEANRFYESKLDLYAPLLSSYHKIDWLNAHHFDYRGLIPMGLALEAPEGMYNTK